MTAQWSILISFTCAVTKIMNGTELRNTLNLKTKASNHSDLNFQTHFRQGDDCRKNNLKIVYIKSIIFLFVILYTLF